MEENYNTLCEDATASASMLKRIAAAVDKRVEIRFVPKKEKLQPA
jgi:hypothetical protein